MRNYELVLVLNPELGEEQVKDSLASIQKLIESLKGKVKKTTDWGKKELSYLIKKHNQGRYFLLLLEFPPESIVKLEQKFKLEEKLIRYLIVNVKEKEEPVKAQK